VSEIFAGFQTARRSSTRFVNSARRKGFSPKEESLTDHFLSRLPESVQVRTFTRAQESSTTGADWLWWWTDGSEWFGALVQAKRRQEGRTPYDFRYRPRPSVRNPDPDRQVDTLLRAAHSLSVPAVYVLYNHGQLSPSTTDLCGRVGGERPCTSLAVAVLPALVAQFRSVFGDDSIGDAKPVECLACPTNSQRVTPWFTRMTTPAMMRFLRHSATLPRLVAAGLIQQIASVRMDQFRDFSRTQLIYGPSREQVVRDVGDDTGHFSEAWVAHVMRGLRSSPPRWVRELEEHGEFDVDLPIDIGGVVIVRDAADPLAAEE
jgi:hypothetical protein